MKKNGSFISIIIIIGLAVILLAGLALGIILPGNAKRIGDIRPPVGFSRISTEDPYAIFLRNLALKKRGSIVHLYNGDIARLQFLSARVIDMPVLSRDEQCADMTMRIRAEYLWSTGQYGKICFKTVSGKDQRYSGGASRSKLEGYLKSVYGYSNTSSVYNETKFREIKDVQPGDVLVYPSRHKGRYGHAILVADVARNRSGKVAILCVEGNTPAREAHVVRNLNPLRNPWFILDGDEDVIRVSVFHFKRQELRHY